MSQRRLYLSFSRFVDDYANGTVTEEDFENCLFFFSKNLSGPILYFSMPFAIRKFPELYDHCMKQMEHLGRIVTNMMDEEDGRYLPLLPDAYGTFDKTSGYKGLNLLLSRHGFVNFPIPDRPHYHPHWAAEAVLSVHPSMDVRVQRCSDRYKIGNGPWQLFWPDPTIKAS